MALRISRDLLIGAVVLTAAIGAVIVFGFSSTSKFKTSATFVDAGTQIIVQIEPIHPYLAEKRRSLVLHKAGVPDQRVQLLLDTGGNSRLQLYRLRDGTVLVRGLSDAFTLDTVRHTIVAADKAAPHAGTYLGAFDATAKDEWQFVQASQSPEK